MSPASPPLRADSLPAEPPGKSHRFSYILVVNQIHQLNHQAPWRSLPETSAKDVSLWLKPLLYNAICLLALNQTGLAHIGGRTHLLLALSCFSEYKTYLVIVAAAKSQVTHNRSKRSFRS